MRLTVIRVMIMRMIFPAVVAVPFFLMVGQKARASTDTASVFTVQQRAAIVAIVRQALKDDPGILTDAVQSLREKAQAEQQVHNHVSVRRNWTALTTAPSYAVRGNPHGSFTIVEFLDPRCGYCRKMMPVVDSFLKRHPDVRLVEKMVPVLGSASVVAVRAVFAAALQGHYADMRHALMSDAAKPDEARLRKLVQEQGMDEVRFFKDMKSPEVAALIALNLDQAQKVGLDGTPTFLFGQSVEVPGALSLENMDDYLNEARNH